MPHWSTDPLKKKAVQEKIAAKARGRKPTPEASAKKSASLLLYYSTQTEEQKQARVSAARARAQTPEAKRKRLEGHARWRARNPGVPGSTGLRPKEAVHLFFAAHPGASDAECAKAIGRSVDMVRRYRSPSSRKPYKRDLLQKLARSIDHAVIVRALNRDPQAHRLPALLDAIAANLPLTVCYRRAGMGHTTGERVVEVVLREIGGFERGDWRGCNRYRKRTVAPTTGSASPE